MKFTFKYLLLVISIFCNTKIFCEDLSSNNGKLIFATVVYRHGDRTPITAYKNDPWGNLTYWPVDWGQLTNLGKQQHYELGKWLRQRYNGTVLSEKYINTEFYIQSSDIDRTLMSAAANLAGMFPPNDDQIWNPEFNWQPIPIHTIPEEYDTMISPHRPCPAYEYYFDDMKRSEQIQQMNIRYDKLYKFLTEKSGSPITDPITLRSLFNTLYIENLYNLTLPEWTKEAYANGDMEYLAHFAFAMDTLTPQMAKLKYGILLKDILTRFKNKTESKLDPDRSMWVYSGHDTTLSGLLNTMNMFSLHQPPYAASLLFELRIQNDKPFVQIFYRNTTETPVPLMIPGCGKSCALEKMFEIFQDVMPKFDFETECAHSAIENNTNPIKSLATVNGSRLIPASLGTVALIIWYFTKSFGTTIFD